MAIFAYLRVSTTDQTTEQQLTQIEAAGYKVARDRVFIEHGVSGKVPALQRQQFQRLHDRMTNGDSLIVARLDRLGRDTLDVISTIDSLIKCGVSVNVLGLGVLDNTPQSRLTLTMLSAISEFERGLISERTKAKLAQLKQEGVKLGRPTKIDDQALRERAVALFAQGWSWRKVAVETGVALSTLQRLMKANHLVVDLLNEAPE